MSKTKRGIKYTLGKTKDSPNWYIKWSEGRKPERRSTRTSDWTEAQIVYANFLLELEQPEERTPDKLLITAALDDYIMEHAVNIVASDTAGYHRTHLVGYFGERLVSYLTPKAVQGYTEHRYEAGVKPGTVRRELTTLSAALHHARKQGRLTEVPFIKMPQAPRGKDRWLTRDEAIALLEACRSRHMRLFCELALNTGQRKGAILDLTWFQVDFERRTINFNPPDRQETNKRRAIVPMNDHIFAVLKEAKTKAKTAHVIEYKSKPVREVRIGFKRNAALAGLGEDVTPHTLRHTAGSWMAQAGVDMYIISQILGHSLGSTTKRYAHLHPSHMRKGIDVLATCQLIANNSAKTGQKTPTTGRRKQGK